MLNARGVAAEALQTLEGNQHVVYKKNQVSIYVYIGIPLVNMQHAGEEHIVPVYHMEIANEEEKGVMRLLISFNVLSSCLASFLCLTCAKVIYCAGRGVANDLPVKLIAISSESSFF